MRWRPPPDSDTAAYIKHISKYIIEILLAQIFICTEESLTAADDPNMSTDIPTLDLRYPEVDTASHMAVELILKTANYYYLSHFRNAAVSCCSNSLLIPPTPPFAKVFFIAV